MTKYHQITRNAVLIKSLQEKVHLTFKNKNINDIEYHKWEMACKEFHDRYSELAFYNGDRNYRQLIRNGDNDAIEYYLNFIEVRPYFFRSGYIYKDLIRVFKNCKLSPTQKSRFMKIFTLYQKYKKSAQQVDAPE